MRTTRTPPPAAATYTKQPAKTGIGCFVLVLFLVIVPTFLNAITKSTRSSTSTPSSTKTTATPTPGVIPSSRPTSVSDPSAPFPSATPSTIVLEVTSSTPGQVETSTRIYTSDSSDPSKRELKVTTPWAVAIDLSGSRVSSISFGAYSTKQTGLVRCRILADGIVVEQSVGTYASCYVSPSQLKPR